MTSLVIYTNDQYQLFYFRVYSTKMTTLSNTYPKLNKIIPKYIICVDDECTFILDINGVIHGLTYDGYYTSSGLHDNLYCTSITDCILMKVYVTNSTCKILLFGFDKRTSTITIESTKIGYFDDPNKRKKYSPTIKYIHNIQSYTITKHNSIILQGFENEIYVYNGSQQFDKFYNVEHKLYVNGRIYIEKDNVLYNSVRATVNHVNTLTKGGKISVVPDSAFYCYYSEHGNIISLSVDHNNVEYRNMGLNGSLEITSTSAYVAMIEIDAYIFLIFSEEVICIRPYNNNPLKLKLIGIPITNNLVAHGLATNTFVWTPNTHHHLSKYRRKIVNTIILYNKYTNYYKVPKYILLDIISYTFSCYPNNNNN